MRAKRRIAILAAAAALLLGADAADAVESPHGDLDLTCETCHVTSGWTAVHFSHEATGFALDRAHGRVACAACHSIANFSAARSACGSCHPDVHEGGLGPDCGRCHLPERWETFDVERIHTGTRLPLMDRHIRIDCRNCHPALLEGDFATSASGCVDCHEDAYLATSNPGHVALGLGTLCEKCHEPVRWRPAFFPSHDPFFPIFSGAHRGEWDACSDCHPDAATFGVFRCSPCHRQPDMDDKHRGVSGYVYEDTACLACHPDGSKEGAGIGNHDADYFPITSGTHDGVWDTCSRCHTVSGDYTRYSCVGCHEHDQPTMDAAHGGIPGYTWESGLCYGCHPTGQAAEFGTHDALYFPVYSGTHDGTWDACTRCHVDANDWAAFSCFGCHEHDQAPTDTAHNGIPDYRYDSGACYACHPTGEGGSFGDHDALYFPVYSGKHRDAWSLCTDCHPTPGDYAVFTCIDCHEHDRSKTDDEHREVSGYAYESAACYGCHPRGEGGDLHWGRPLETH